MDQRVEMPFVDPQYQQKIETILEQPPASPAKSQPIRLPTTNKGASDFSKRNLYDAQQAAEYREYCMYRRIVSSVNSPKTAIMHDTETEEKLLSRRHSFTHLQELHYFNNPKEEEDYKPLTPTLIPPNFYAIDKNNHYQEKQNSSGNHHSHSQRIFHHQDNQDIPKLHDYPDNFSEDEGIFDMDL